MLGEDSYVPFPYFYDVTAWSGPLLLNVPAGRTGAKLRPKSAPVPTLRRAGRAAGASHRRGRLADRRRHVRVRVRGLAALAARREVAGALPLAHDPRRRSRTRWPRSTCSSCPTATRRRRTTSSGRPVGRRCAPGSPTAARIVTWRGGTQLAALMELTTAELAEPTSDVPGLPDPGERRADAARARRGLQRLELLRVRLRDVHRRRRPASRSASPTPPRRAGSSPASRTAPRSSAARPRSWTSRTPTAGSSRSPASRTSAPSPTGRRRSSGTRSTAPTLPGARFR